MVYASKSFIKSMASIFNLFPSTDYANMYKKTYRQSVEEDMAKTSQDLNAAIIMYTKHYKPLNSQKPLKHRNAK